MFGWLELRRRLRLAQEAPRTSSLNASSGGSTLMRDGALQPQVDGAVDDRHAAAPDLGLAHRRRSPTATIDAVAQIVGHWRARGRATARAAPPRPSAP